MAKQSYNLFLKHENNPLHPSRLQWNAYIELEKQVFEAWRKLQNDVKRRASPQVLLEDKNRLMLLLGECNYLAHEYMRCIDYRPSKKPAKPAKKSTPRRKKR